jgi:AcrR family transcriptional regulator
MTRGQAARSSTDGRLLRSERSRELIADALYELLGDGDLEPSAQKVADRAGVGIRTVFRLFSDMDALYATVNARLAVEVAPMLRDGPPEGALLIERAESLVADRVALFERVGSYMRATNRNRDRSAFLAAEYRKLIVRLRERLLCWLPELRGAPPSLVEALDQATSFEAWDRLRGDQRLSRPRARAAMDCATQALVKELEAKG